MKEIFFNPGIGTKQNIPTIGIINSYTKIGTNKVIPTIGTIYDIVPIFSTCVFLCLSFDCVKCHDFPPKQRMSNSSPVTLSCMVSLWSIMPLTSLHKFILQIDFSPPQKRKKRMCQFLGQV